MKIEKLTLPPVLWLPLASAGKNAHLLVTAGDAVTAGETIAVAGEHGVNICAPCGGRIGAVKTMPLAATSARESLCIMLECENTGETFNPHIPLSAPQYNKDPRPPLKASGIIGLGGGAYPAWRKWRRGLRLMVINAIEGDPNISCDNALIYQHGQETVHAAQRTGFHFGVDKILFALAKEHTLQNIKQTEIHRIIGNYGLGNEKLLIAHLLNRPIATSQLPADSGIICFNLATVLAIDAYLQHGAPLVGRVITVHSEQTSINLYIPFGTSVSDIASFLKVKALDRIHISVGGTSSETSLPPQAICWGGSNAITLNPQAKQQQPAPCIRCGDCLPACPVALSPLRLHALALDNKDATLRQERLLDCLECRRCDDACPSGIALTKTFITAKRRIKKEDAIKTRADNWRFLHEAHIARQQRPKTTATINAKTTAATARQKALERISGS